MMTFFADPSNTVGKIPYIMDIWPHLTMGDSAPTEVVRKFKTRWTLHTRPLIVTDSGFGSFQLATEWTEWGGKVLFSCPLDNRADLWQATHFNLPSSNWRGAVCSSSGIVIASQKKTKCNADGTVDGEITKNIITTAFDCDKWDLQAVSPATATGKFSELISIFGFNFIQVLRQLQPPLLSPQIIWTQICPQQQLLLPKW